MSFTAPKTPYQSTKPTNQPVAKAIHLLGHSFDGTSCFRKGAHLGPEAMREVSEGFESYSPYSKASLEERPLYDLGNLSFSDDWEASFQFLTGFYQELEIKKDRMRFLTLGGEHSISYLPIKKYLDEFDNLGLVHLDAHADLRDGYQGYQHSHASVLFRVLEHFKAGHDLFQFGIRSGLKEEFEMMEEGKYLSPNKNHFLQRLQAIPNQRPLYLTLDLDFFDPAVMPGTGTPEAGGYSFHDFNQIMDVLRQKNLVGADVVELAPNYDPSGISVCLASQVVRELLLSLKV